MYQKDSIYTATFKLLCTPHFVRLFCSRSLMTGIGPNTKREREREQLESLSFASENAYTIEAPFVWVSVNELLQHWDSFWTSWRSPGTPASGRNGRRRNICQGTKVVKNIFFRHSKARRKKIFFSSRIEWRGKQ